MNRFLLVGGAPSSGSTLLMQQLGMHGDVLVIPETGIFAHGRNLDGQVPDGSQSGLQHDLPWLDVPTKTAGTLGWNNIDVEGNLRRFPDAFSFMNACIAPGTGKYLVEKTPENVFAFKTLLELPGGHRVVVTSRDCLSVVQSLMRRGFLLLEAFLIWFSHSFESWKLIRDYPERVFHCRYSDLTAATVDTIDAIRDFWHLDAQPDEVNEQAAPFSQHISALDETVICNNDPDPEVDPSAIVDESELALLFQLSSWNLSGSAWTRAPWEKAISATPENLIGLEYDVLAEKLVFSVEGNGFFRIGALDKALEEDSGSLQPANVAEDRLSPVPLDSQSLILRTLADHYPMFIEQG